MLQKSPTITGFGCKKPLVNTGISTTFTSTRDRRMSEPSTVYPPYPKGRPLLSGKMIFRTSKKPMLFVGYIRLVFCSLEQVSVSKNNHSASQDSPIFFVKPHVYSSVAAIRCRVGFCYLPPKRPICPIHPIHPSMEPLWP